MNSKILTVKEYNAANDWINHFKRSAAPDMIVLHETAGASAFSSYEWAIKPNVQKGYHFIIDRPWGKKPPFNDPKWDGQIWQCAPLHNQSKSEWYGTNHVGSSVRMNGIKRSINDRAIGVSFANIGDGKDMRTKRQRQSAIELITWLKTEIPSLVYITTHYDLQIWNRRDPVGFDPTYIDDLVGLQYVRPTNSELVSAAGKYTTGNSNDTAHAIAAAKQWIKNGRPIPTY